MATGAAWMVAFKFTERTLTLVSTVVLARLLVPADFGIVAMAMSIVATLEVLTSFSMDVAIIQRPNVERSHLDTAWTFNVIFGVLVALLLVVVARPTAAFYREPNLVAIMCLLAVGWLAQGFENIGPVAFRRELDFHKEYWFLSAKKFATFLITIPLAFWLRNYWALVIGTVTGKFVSVAISFWVHHFRPRLELKGARDLMGFSRWLVMNNILFFVNQRTTDIVIGRIAGAQALGIYNLSFEISNMPTSELAAPINRAVLPGYSKMHRETGSISESYLGIIGLIALFSVPAGAGIAAIADPFVHVVLGDKWLATIPLIQILAFYGCVNSLGTNTGMVMLAVGRPSLLTIMAIVQMLVLVPAVVYGTYAGGLHGTAWAMLVTVIVLTPLNFAILCHVLGIRMRTMLLPFWRPIVAAGVMYCAVSATLHFLHGAGLEGAILQLVAGIVTGLLSYGLSILLFWQLAGRPSGAETMLLGRARAMLATSR
jgi:O-antigen/teichoic acid export membrane protein